jgi:gas vesicle protein
MENQDKEQQPNGNTAIPFWAGILMGGLAGATMMLLLAPQSGKETRSQIQRKGSDLRDQTVEIAEGTVEQVRQTAQQITGDVREKAEELQQRGQDMFVEQQKRLSTFTEIRNKDIEISV